MSPMANAMAMAHVFPLWGVWWLMAATMMTGAKA